MGDRYMRVSIQGGLPGGEVWSVNPAFQADFTDTAPPHAAMQAWCNQIAGSLDSVISSDMKNALSSQGTITGIRINAYGSNGRLEDYVTAPPSSAYSGTGTLNQPPTTAVALSLYSATVTRQGRGRLFWPALTLNLSSTTGRLQPATTAALSAGAVAMLAALQAAAPSALNADPCIYSAKSGATHPVTSVRVGDVPDSQRGRKSALVETYSSRVYPPS